MRSPGAPIVSEREDAGVHVSANKVVCHGSAEDDRAAEAGRSRSTVPAGIEFVETPPTAGPRAAHLRRRAPRWPETFPRKFRGFVSLAAEELKLSFPAGRSFEIRATNQSPLSC